MINPVNQINYQGYYVKPYGLKQKQAVKSGEISLSGYEAGRAI